MKRKSSLASLGEAETDGLWDDSNNLTFTPLGSGREVGRSCHILSFKGKQIMLDCGIHPGHKGIEMLPFLDQVDMSKIDLLLVTHFHLDHAASIPHLTERTGFRGQVFMTSATKAVLRLVLKDYARILASDPNEPPLYTQEELARCLEKCQTVGFHQVIEVEGIKITPYHAGHVLGAAMFLMEIAGVKILYTGDYSREDDRHLRGAEIPSIRPDVLIVEATFGLMVHESREQREKRFTESVEKIVRRGGNCLIPMGALGAVQELLLILEDHWNKNPDLKGIPIYHTSRIANEALTIYRSFINTMNEAMRSNKLSQPWTFENIGSLGEREEIVGPAVVLASPGYLQSGKSRKLFELWCSERRNGVILAGYSVEGTLAKELSREGAIREVESMNGTLLPVECEVKTITFAAHSDFIGTKSFVDQLKPKNIIFVHGEAEQMRKLRSKLQHEAQLANQETEFFSPDNCKTVTLRFQEQRIVKAYGGELVQRQMRTRGSRVAGFLVRKDLTDRLIATEDVRLYTQLKTAAVKQKLHIPFHPKFEHLESCVSKLFLPERTGQNELTIGGAVSLALKANVVCMMWEASPANDMVADALTAIIMQAESGIPAVRLGTCCSAHAHHAMPKKKVIVAPIADQEGATVEEVDETEAKETGTEDGEISKLETSGTEGSQGEATGHGAAQSTLAAGQVGGDATAPANESQTGATAEQPSSEPGADVATVLKESQTAELFMRLLVERHGQENIAVSGDELRVLGSEDGSVMVKFNVTGHVSSIEGSGEEVEALELDTRRLAQLAVQTMHPII